MLVEAPKAQHIEAEALERQCAMRVLHSKLAAGGGGGGKALLIAVHRTAPWHPCTKPLFDTVCKLRSEMTIVGKILAERQVAELKRARSAPTCRARAANRRTIDIVIRGAFIIAGGTAKHVVDTVKTKLFACGRKLLACWLAKFEEIKAAAGGAYEWTGLQPRALAQHKLAGLLVVSDTCNAALATKRRLASAVVEAAAHAEIGAEAWRARSEPEQGKAVRVLIRNIILADMTAAGAADRKHQVEELLATFSSFERMSTA
eukprot:1054740-Pleurochrysis_carterae.AAC.2